MSLPAQEEHILYEKSIYVCTHVFGTANGSRMTEVYLWAGTGVPESAVEDAQLFAKRVAKDAAPGQRTTPSVQLIRQCREPAGFFQALGGIVIVRMGSRAESATRPYMLSGRPHMGHLAFDEVDFDLGSLCSGLPFIVVKPITLQETQVFLWKGAQCGPEAIGSARLISMDLDASGSMSESNEGSETPSFLSLFPSNPKQSLPNYTANFFGLSDHIPPRLFRIDALPPRRSSSSFAWATSLLSRRPSWTGSRPTSSASNKGTPLSPPLDFNSPSGAGPRYEAIELSPLSQTDFEPESCYVLDAVHSLYVLPGPLMTTSKQPPSDTSAQQWGDIFMQALLFANDYAILAAGMQDRVCVPKAVVCFGSDLPADARVLFRTWDTRRRLWGTAGLMAGKRVSSSSTGGGGGGKEDEGLCVGVGEVVGVCAAR